jgi:hypothetical protein
MHAGDDNSPTELIAPTIPAGSPVEALFPDFDSPRPGWFHYTKRAGPMVGRHNKPKHRLPSDQAQRQRTRTVEMVDVAGTAHRLTVDAAADGRPRGRYSALCGEDVLPAALIAREARYCQLCAPMTVPRQRSRRAR